MTIDTQSNNKRIAKNTLLLYFRMLFTMAVSLYTSRVVLDVLGLDDYGIYNVVGGVVAMFTVLSGSLTTSISRFITYELGHGDKEKLKRVFSTSVSIQIGLALLVFILAEIIGVWFLNCKMIIPDNRLDAANWVLQCSILTFMINLISVPYNAAIIAHEKMSAFAYISIIEIILKLLVVYLLAISPIDRLVIYSIMLAAVALLIRLIYSIYCNRHFEETIYIPIWDKPIFKEMFEFAGWNFFGNTAYIFNTQGVNLLINLFFGIAMNAARSVAVQVDNAIMGFVNNFTMAIQPQITKSYAAGNLSYMFTLMNRGTKFSAYIMFFFLIPLEFETETILGIWLKEVPEHSVIFMRLVLFASFCGVIGNYLYYGIMASGMIKRYQLVVTSLGALVFPITWLAYILGLHAATTYIIYGLIYSSLNIIRINTLKRQMNFPRMTFFTDAVIPMAKVGILAFIPALVLTRFMNPSLFRFLLTTIVSILSTAIFTYIVGLTVKERAFVKEKMEVIKLKIINKIG